MESIPNPVRVGVVLSAGGLRGAAHVGVLRQLVRHGIPIDVIVGVSAGAIIAAYYAGVGLDLDDLVADAGAFRGRHLLMHSLNTHLCRRFDRALGPWCGIIPERLRQLESAAFDRLHHSIRGLGIACHDVATGRPRYFATGLDHGAKLHEVAKASASIPVLFAPLPVACSQEHWLLTDGGISDSVPLAFARRGPLAATHLVVSDCRSLGTPAAPASDVVWIRPRMASTGTLWGPRHGLLSAVNQGEAAVTEDVVTRIQGWFHIGRRETADGRPLTADCPLPQ
jgi:NTE family protein